MNDDIGFFPPLGVSNPRDRSTPLFTFNTPRRHVDLETADEVHERLMSRLRVYEQAPAPWPRVLVFLFAVACVPVFVTAAVFFKNW
jgi:hypothetical protein